MNSQKIWLLTVALFCFGLLGAALYVQYVLYMFPCPWCVIQRYAFFMISLTCLISAFLSPGAARRGSVFGVLFALGGAGAAIWLIWLQAHPSASCGIDPVETSLNQFPAAKLLPLLFEANGMCATEYDPIFGLTVPRWSLLSFIAIIIVLVARIVRDRRTQILGHQ